MASSSTTTPPTRPRAKRGASSIVDQPKQPSDQRDVRSKLSDFTRVVDEIVTENEDTKHELATLKQQLAESANQLRISKTENEDKERELAQRTDEIEELHAEKRELQFRIDSFAHEEVEIVNLRAVVASIKAHLRDYITLDTVGASMLTTTGQVCTNGSLILII